VAGSASALDLNLVPSNVGFNTPIGIDFQETTGQLVLSVNYPSGTGPAPLTGNLALADPVTGTSVPFSGLSGLDNELKIATVRASPCQAGTSFVVGEVFTGNGNAGQVIRVSSNGGVVINPWVSLPGETALVRGSLFQDRFNSAGCDLIVVTGNEQNGTAANDNVGNVWRVTSGATPSLLASPGTHLEGVTTVPNVPAVYGPLAGRILAGAEQYLVNGNSPTGYVSYDPNGGKIFAVDPAGGDHWFTISAALPTTCTPPTALPDHCNYQTATAFHPEDLDIIRAKADFFGVAFRDGVVYEVKFADQSASNFRDRCGQVLITQEFPKIETGVPHSGLYALRWDAASSAFVVDELSANVQVQQWEHTTFTSGSDCATTITVAKTPDNGTFKVGDTLTWTIVVTNTGVLTAGSVTINDQLPKGPGNDLTWTVFSTTAGTCSINATQLLHCDLGDIAPSGSVTVVVKSSNVNGAPAADCNGTKITNTATASASNAADASDDGDMTCTPPPHLTVVKTPDNGTFTQGGAVSFTIKVTNDGGSDSTNAKLSDQLPTNGTLNWSGAAVTTTQGSCSVSATSLLTCSFGTIAPNGSVTVTVSLSSTPAAACQSQPNPHAIATDDQGDNAEDSGSLSCAPPQLLGQIAPTQTTCQEFINGTSSTLGQINYPVSNGKIGQGINPGVFFFYTKITTSTPNQVVTVSQSNTSTNNAALFQVQQDQARLYTGNCSSWTAGTLIANSSGASYTIATPGTYVISIKYSTKSIAGTTAPVPANITYNFSTSLGGSTGASVLLKKQ
jgi:uncharacterized repeat protein (TIGR01451 family)